MVILVLAEAYRRELWGVLRKRGQVTHFLWGPRGRFQVAVDFDFEKINHPPKGLQVNLSLLKVGPLKSLKSPPTHGPVRL